jgi:hypothetical protein
MHGLVATAVKPPAWRTGSAVAAVGDWPVVGVGVVLVTVVVAVAVAVADPPSTVPVTVATFVSTVPLAAVDGTTATIVTAALPPAASVPMLQVTLLVPAAPVQVPTVDVGVDDRVIPAGSVSVNVTPVAAPALVMGTV